MAVLHRKKDGGYYIVGPPHGGANTICTWQITPEGLSYLRGHGIRDEGRATRPPGTLRQEADLDGEDRSGTYRPPIII